MAANQQKKRSEQSGQESKSITKKRPHSIIFDPAEKVTRGSFKDEVNINNVIKRFVRTGELPKARAEAQYGEAPSQTLHEAACINAELASMDERGEFDDWSESEAPEDKKADSEGETPPESQEEPEAPQSAPEARD